MCALEADPEILRQKKMYLQALRQVNPEEFLPVLTQVHNEVFSRTDCLACASCCTSIPPIVNRSDIKRLAAHQGIAPKIFQKRYVLEDIDGEMTLNGVPCTFLQSDNQCSVYDIRPEACRRYPHTDEKEYVRRATLNFSNAQLCPAADAILNRLQQIFPVP